jgi:L-alanine-DL-glutamate epimerase-like enolase superfamily enzyme
MMSLLDDVVELARRFRRTLGDQLTLMVGVDYLLNDVPTAVRVCRELEELDIYLFETPFPVDSPEPYAQRVAQTSIPLARCEHRVTRWEFFEMMDRGRFSVVQR